MFGIAAAVGTIKDWEAYTLILCAWCVFFCEEHHGVDADMLTPWVWPSRYVQRAQATEHSTMGPGSTTLTCSQSGQAAGVSGQPDGLLQTMVRVIAPLIARAKKQDAMLTSSQSFTDWQASSLYVSLQMPQISDSLSAGVKQMCLGVSAVDLSCRHQGSSLRDAVRPEGV